MIGETKTTYQLENLDTGRRIGADGIEVSRFVPRKLWFDVVSEPSPEAIALTGPTPLYQEPDPYHLRESNLPSAVKIWDINNGIDVYTTRTKEWYKANGVETQRDHKLEVFARHAVRAPCCPRAMLPARHHRFKSRVWHASTPSRSSMAIPTRVRRPRFPARSTSSMVLKTSTTPTPVSTATGKVASSRHGAARTPNRKAIAAP